MTEKTIFCAVPFVEGFTDPMARYRNCCSTYPQTISRPGITFKDWWFGQIMQEFRGKFGTEILPAECQRCQIKERVQGQSFRTAVNLASGIAAVPDSITWPSRWNIVFSNLCNLACWSCNETASSTIEAHKKKIGILPENHIDVEKEFQKIWPDLRDSIVTSYDDHPGITITMSGGEPLYNPQVLDFLEFLKRQGLSSRTKLEFHTNATMLNNRIKSILAQADWQHICMFLSLDAVGSKAEWLRYGCRWTNVESNIDSLKMLAHYVEAHCTLSVLNIMDLVNLKHFCADKDLDLQIMTLADPAFMSLLAWDQEKDLLVDGEALSKEGYGYYYELLGSSPMEGARDQLKNYISKFNNLRKPLKEFDPALASVLMIS